TTSEDRNGRRGRRVLWRRLGPRLPCRHRGAGAPVFAHCPDRRVRGISEAEPGLDEPRREEGNTEGQRHPQYRPWERELEGGVERLEDGQVPEIRGVGELTSEPQRSHL